MSDWKARAEREAAAIIAEALSSGDSLNAHYGTLVSLVALGWLQGTIYGNHEALERLDCALDELKASL